MRYTLPTQHRPHFGIQANKGKLDASGVTKAGNANIADIHNKRVLVDHAFIVAGGEITKATRNWLGNALDGQSRRRSAVLGLGAAIRVEHHAHCLQGFGLHAMKDVHARAGRRSPPGIAEPSNMMGDRVFVQVCAHGTTTARPRTFPSLRSR